MSKRRRASRGANERTQRTPGRRAPGPISDRNRTTTLRQHAFPAVGRVAHLEKCSRDPASLPPLAPPTAAILCRAHNFRRRPPLAPPTAAILLCAHHPRRRPPLAPPAAAILRCAQHTPGGGLFLTARGGLASLDTREETHSTHISPAAHYCERGVTNGWARSKKNGAHYAPRELDLIRVIKRRVVVVAAAASPAGVAVAPARRAPRRRRTNPTAAARRAAVRGLRQRRWHT